MNFKDYPQKIKPARKLCILNSMESVLDLSSLIKMFLKNKEVAYVRP